MDKPLKDGTIIYKPKFKNTYIDVRPLREYFGTALMRLNILMDDKDYYTDIIVDVKGDKGDLYDPTEGIFAPHILLKVEDNPIEEALEEVTDLVGDICHPSDGVRTRTHYHLRYPK